MLKHLHFLRNKQKINISQYPTLEKCFFGAVILSKNAGFDRHQYSGYRIGFDKHGSFSFRGVGLSRNVIIFEIDMSSFVHVDNKKKIF